MNVLSLGTTEECVNMTKALIDTCGAEGAFMLAPDMPLVFARDAKPENFRAVAKTIDTYGRF